MSLILKDLGIKNFRNHHTLKINEQKELIIIIGKNASGKTNIIEALQLVTMFKSFKNPQWSQVVQYEKKASLIIASFLQNERDITIKLEIENGKRSYQLNGKKKQISEIQGIIPCVIFIPDDLNLIKNSSETRRDLIDDIGQQLSQNYCLLANDYKKTIKQRNNVLKEFKDGEKNQIILESWNESLIKLGASLFINRVKLLKRLIEKTKNEYESIINGEKLSSIYIPSFYIDEKYNDKKDFSDKVYSINKKEAEDLLREALKKKEREEKARAKTLVGPHRDEIKFFINNKEARSFASQGQQRSIALALKLGQVSLIKELSGNQPLLLLDDVMSEIDIDRRTKLIKTINSNTQTIITATDLSCFNKNTLKNAKIIELK